MHSWDLNPPTTQPTAEPAHHHPETIRTNQYIRDTALSNMADKLTPPPPPFPPPHSHSHPPLISPLSLWQMKGSADSRLRGIHIR